MRELNRLLGRSSRWLRDVSLVLAVMAVLALSVLGLSVWLPDTDGLSDVVGIVQLFVTGAVVAVGGIFAYRKLQLFRDFEPHLTVTQAVTSRPVGTEYTHIAVTTTLHNSSKVRVEVRESLFRIHQIQPLTDEELEHYYVAAFQDEGDGYIRWPILEIVERGLEPSALVVEPGEYHHEPCEFIVSKEVETVLVYAFFYDNEWSEGSRSAQGWTATTVHDMMLNDRPHEE